VLRSPGSLHETIPFVDLTSERLSTLLDEVLNSSIYRENARNFQKIISKTNGLPRAQISLSDPSELIQNRRTNMQAEPPKQRSGCRTKHQPSVAFPGGDRSVIQQIQNL
jgi:hypothetical protein